MRTRVVGTSRQDDVCVLHVRLNEIVKVLSHEPIVSAEHLDGVSSSLLDVADDSPAESDVRVAVDEYLEVE